MLFLIFIAVVLKSYGNENARNFRNKNFNILQMKKILTLLLCVLANLNMAYSQDIVKPLASQQDLLKSNNAELALNKKNSF